MSFNPIPIIDQLDANGPVFEALFANVSNELAKYRPAKEHWSILEIACHLADEEREDFSARVKSTLNDPTCDLTPIDPPGWAISRNYIAQDFLAKVDEFLELRKSSIAWLRGLKDANWQNAFQHPEYGPLSSQLFLENWLAHDYLHIRQINRRKYEYHRQHAVSRLDYAGDW